MNLSTSKGRTAHPASIFRLFFLLVLILSLLLTACTEDTTATPATTIGSTPASSNSFAQMLNYVPDTPNNNLEVVYNNYATTFKTFGFENPTYASLLKPSASGASIVTATRNLQPSPVLGLSRFAAGGTKSKVGWSLEEVEAEIYTGPPSSDVVLAGRFDNTAIDKALTTVGYKKQDVSGGSLYNIRPDSTIDLQSAQLIPDALANINNVGVGKNYLVVSSINKTAVTGLGLTAGSDKTIKTLSQNAGFKAISTAFGPVQSAIVSNQIFTSTAVLAQNPRLNSTSATALAKTYGDLAKVPLPKLAAIGYSEPKQGDVTFLLANYYDTPEKAQKALPIIENALKTGTSFASNQPYSALWQVTSAEVQGNLTLYKLKPAAGRLLVIAQFFYQRDLPILYGNE